MITRQIIRSINEDIKEALKSVEEKHGVKISLGNSSYTQAEYTTKMKVVTPEAENVNKEDGKRNAKLLGLPEDVIGKTITLRGKTYEVVRLDLGKPKNPVIIQKVGTDKTYKIGVEMLKGSLV